MRTNNIFFLKWGWEPTIVIASIKFFTSLETLRSWELNDAYQTKITHSINIDTQPITEVPQSMFIKRKQTASLRSIDQAPSIVLIAFAFLKSNGISSLASGSHFARSVSSRIEFVIKELIVFLISKLFEKDKYATAKVHKYWRPVQLTVIDMFN